MPVCCPMTVVRSEEPFLCGNIEERRVEKR